MALSPAQRIEATAAQPRDDAAADCSGTVATELLERHRASRQRFDSADYVMGDRFQRSLALKPALHPVCSAANSSGDASDVELEPEPESRKLEQVDASTSAYPHQRVRRLRLQRFDSADWAMDLQNDGAGASVSTASSDVSGAASTGNVAQLLLERHAFKTCTFVGVATTSATPDARCAEQA